MKYIQILDTIPSHIMDMSKRRSKHEKS